VEIHDPTASASLENNGETAFHVHLLEPLSAAAFTLLKIYQMFDVSVLVEADQFSDFMQP
jgi:hypothetical protein